MVSRTTALALAGIFLGCGGTAPHVKDPPVWRVGGGVPAQVGCAEVDAWVVKSGRVGAGVTVRSSSNSADCKLELRRAAIVLAGGPEYLGSWQGDRVVALGPEPVHVYLIFPFDNLAAWRSGMRHGELVLELTAGTSGIDTWASTATTLRLPLEHGAFPTTWRVHFENFHEMLLANPGKRPANSHHWTDLQASCAAIGWDGGVETGRLFQAVLHVRTKELSCGLTVRAAELVRGGAPIPAMRLPPRLTARKEGGVNIAIEFAMPPQADPERGLLRLHVQDLSGKQLELEWPIILPDPFNSRHARHSP